MGVEPFLLSSTITALVAQRLVRRLCSECKTPYKPTAMEQAELGIRNSNVSFYKPQGCASCQDIGYTGRLGIYEIVTLDDKLRAMIHDGATESDMSKYAFSKRQTLLGSGADKVLAGETSAEEVLRVCKSNTAEDI